MEELWAYVKYGRPADAEDAVRSFDGIEFQNEFTSYGGELARVE